MLISYICQAHAPGYERLSSGIPSVPELQALIEDAWDNGINADGRNEMGGIKGTRKHIGTPEVCLAFTICFSRSIQNIVATMGSLFIESAGLNSLLENLNLNVIVLTTFL